MVSLGDGRVRIEAQTREQQAKRQRIQVSPLGLAGGFSCPGQLQEGEEVGVCWGQGVAGAGQWGCGGGGWAVSPEGREAPGRNGRAGLKHCAPTLRPLLLQIPFPFSFWALVTFGAKLTNIGLENFTIFLTSSSHILDSQILI